MFNAARRGPASISRLFRATSSIVRIPSTRPSALFLSLQNTARPALEARWIHASQFRSQEAVATRTKESYEDSQEQRPRESVDVTKFHELIKHNLVHPNVVEAITKGMGHHTMTQVQTLTINQGLQGNDIIAQARTGTGKTIGFLLPLIQNILKRDPKLAERQRYTKARPSDIRAIIISPTRELAEQIAVEAEKLCQSTDLRVQVAVGGNHKRTMLQKMQREGCHILVATPGRLNDILTDEYSRVSAPKLNTLVLDEADRLLDQGFSQDIEEITKLLPDRSQVDRQTLLFSATVPREVMHLVRRTLKPDFHFVQTVQEGDIATHDKVPQKIVSVPGMENFMPALVELCKREIDAANRGAAAGSQEVKPFKAIVYSNSTANVQMGAEILGNLKGEAGGLFGRHPLYPAEVSEMHAQLTQQQRTRVSERFRKAKSAIMFSTDVTARGMDFPNVTHVIQVGLPPNREQYIHRIGRTGRGDATGEGWIIVPEAQIPEARNVLRGLPITADKTLETAQVDMTQNAELGESTAATLNQVGEATKMVDRGTKVKAYMAALGQVNPQNAVMLNRWTRYGWGWEEPPSVSPGLAAKLGLSRVPGMKFHDRDSTHGRSNPREGHAGDRRFGDRGGSRGSFDRGGREGGREGGFGGRGGDRDGGRESGFGGRGGDRDGGREGGFGGRGGDRDGGREGGFGGREGGSGGRGGGRGGSSFGRRDYGGRKSLNARGGGRGGDRGYAAREETSF